MGVSIVARLFFVFLSFFHLGVFSCGSQFRVGERVRCLGGENLLWGGGGGGVGGGGGGGGLIGGCEGELEAANSKADEFLVYIYPPVNTV